MYLNVKIDMIEIVYRYGTTAVVKGGTTEITIVVTAAVHPSWAFLRLSEILRTRTDDVMNIRSSKMESGPHNIRSRVSTY